MDGMKKKLVELITEKENDLIQKIVWVPDAFRIEEVADHLIANGVRLEEKQATSDKASKWIPVSERLPDNFVSVIGHMTDSGEFPSVRECYTVGNAFFFPALQDVHPVSHWMHMPEPPKGE